MDESAIRSAIDIVGVYKSFKKSAPEEGEDAPPPGSVWELEMPTEE